MGSIFPRVRFCTYLNRHLVDSCPHAALQHHLQHLGVCRVLVSGKGELLSLLLHVLDGHLNGDKNDLEKQTVVATSTFI